MPSKVLILGGYGNTGMLIAPLLLKEDNIELIIAGRNYDRAKDLAGKLNAEFQTNRVTAARIDASDKEQIKKALQDIRIIVVASSTIDYTKNVAEAALETETDYMDIQLSSPFKLDILSALRKEIENRERCFITDGGYHPGVPAAMARQAASYFDKIEKANIKAAFKMNWKDLKFSKSTVDEFVNELIDYNPLVFKNRHWVPLNMKEAPKHDFGPGFGERYCIPMFMEELHTLPDTNPSLQEMGFYIAGFNRITDYIITPTVFMMAKLFGNRFKNQMSNLFYWSLKSFTKPPYGAVLELEATGEVNGESKSFYMRLYHEDPYFLTAAPAVACLLQYLKGTAKKTGLWFQANLVEPTQFFEDIERFGVEISIKMVV